MLLPELHGVLDADTGGGLAGTRCPREGICIERNSSAFFLSKSVSNTPVDLRGGFALCKKERIQKGPSTEP